MSLAAVESGVGDLHRVRLDDLPLNTRVKINAGGQKFVTTASTLRKQPSSLGEILLRAPIDTEGFLLLPTSSAAFSMILCYLRDGIVDPKARCDVKSRNQLLQDAIYYGISSLVRILRELDLEEEEAAMADPGLSGVGQDEIAAPPRERPSSSSSPSTPSDAAGAGGAATVSVIVGGSSPLIEGSNVRIKEQGM